MYLFQWENAHRFIFIVILLTDLFSKLIQRTWIEHESSINVQDSSYSEEPIQVKELLIMAFEKIGIFFSNKAFFVEYLMRPGLTRTPAAPR